MQSAGGKQHHLGHQNSREEMLSLASARENSITITITNRGLHLPQMAKLQDESDHVRRIHSLRTAALIGWRVACQAGQQAARAAVATIQNGAPINSPQGTANAMVHPKKATFTT